MTINPGWDATCGGGPEIEVPDVVGALRGLRVWRLHETGHLCGLSYPERWLPGVNEARCLSMSRTSEGKVTRTPLTWFAFTMTFGSSGGPYKLDDNGRIVPTNGYEIGVDCPGVAKGNHGCGFYAKHGVTNPGYSGDVTGVVDMFGQVELGPGGLRSQKAEVVAMVGPKPTTRNTEWAVTVKRSAEKDLKAAQLPAWVTPLMWSGKIRAAVAERMKVIDELKGVIKHCDDVLADHARLLDLWENTKRIYGVPVYDTVTEMLEAHPVPSLDHLLDTEEEPDQA